MFTFNCDKEGDNRIQH